jgi:hypothetical protein
MPSLKSLGNLEVTFYLSSPPALNHPWIHFDGILAHLAYLRFLGRDYYLLPSKRLVDVSLPEDLRGFLAETSGLLHASCSLFLPSMPEKYASLSYYKRFEAEGFPKSRKINLGSGYYRNWSLRWVYVPCEAVRFYVRGDRQIIEDLLSDLTHIGNDTRVGWGRIRGMRIKEISEDLSLVWNNRAMRPIPVRYLKQWSDSALLAWRPPYWAAENVELCAPPGAVIELKDDLEF